MLKTYTYPKFPYRQTAAQREGRTERHPVVIIGAGPIGLTMALDCAARGIDCVVLDDNDTVSIGSRAVCYAKRPLEIWHRLQEFGGVHNSHATRLLAREKAAWAASQQAQPAATDDFLRDHGYCTFIHGHTHRAATHDRHARRGQTPDHRLDGAASDRGRGRRDRDAAPVPPTRQRRVPPRSAAARLRGRRGA